MDPEDLLRRIAEQRLVEFSVVPEEARVSVHRSAHSYLAGAVQVLAELDLLDAARGHALSRELLAPMTDPLIASGQLQRVVRSASISTSARAEVNWRRWLVQAVDQMLELGVVSQEEATAITERINDRYPEAPAS